MKSWNYILEKEKKEIVASMKRKQEGCKNAQKRDEEKNEGKIKNKHMTIKEIRTQNNQHRKNLSRGGRKNVEKVS